MFYLIVFLLSFVVSYIFLTARSKLKNFPPGPTWLPFVGCSPQLKQRTKEYGYQHAALTYFSILYDSPVIGLKLGTQLTVAVNGYEAVKRVFTMEEFEGRPDNFFIRIRCLGTRKGITCTDGSHWHEQRSFAVKHLKSLGFGKQTMEKLIQDQITMTMNIFDSKVESEFSPDVASSVMSVLWTLIAGTQFSHDDPNLIKLLNLMQRRAKIFDMTGGTLSQFPWLRFIAPEASGYNLLTTVNQELKSFFMDTITEHKKNFCMEQAKDLIDAYLKEMELNKDNNYTKFTEEQLIMVCLDMFVAGSTTTSNTLSFAILAVSRYLDIQKKMHEEIDKYYHSDQFPCLSDQNQLPYLCAFITEVYRFYSIVPVAGPRRALKETELYGYKIPKDTMILINTWSVHNDPKHWESPHEFLPERFIKNGQFKADEWILTFGLGRRRCLGELLARGYIFIFLARLLQKYDILSNDTNKPPPPLPGLTLSPAPFKIILKKR